MTIFSSLEEFSREEIPAFIKKLLTATGFDTKLALEHLNEDKVTEIENYVNSHREIFDQLLNRTIYERLTSFELLPGHRSIIINLPNALKKIQRTEDSTRSIDYKSSNYSAVLKALIESAAINNDRAPNGHRFSEPLWSYALYVYLMSGRACYECLSANLPIPQPKTIRMYLFI